MSLAAQEEALFALVFDARLRARFAAEGSAALAVLGLDEADRADFDAIRVDALELDAGLRRSMVLSELAIGYPLSFSILSSLADGRDLLLELVDVRTMRTPSVERTFLFGKRLRERLDDVADTGGVGQALRAVLEAELGMAWTSASIRREVLDTGRAPAVPDAPRQDWSSAPTRIAAFVSAAVIPAPHARLREALCPVPDRAIWRHLSSTPTPVRTVLDVLASPEPRLLVARAEIDRMSRCDPTARHVFVELSDGFAQLIGHANGDHSIDALLAALMDAGASEGILAGARRGFEELARAGVLECV